LAIISKFEIAREISKERSILAKGTKDSKENNLSFFVNLESSVIKIGMIIILHLLVIEKVSMNLEILVNKKKKWSG
jgi:hypothetical protein